MSISAVKKIVLFIFCWLFSQSLLAQLHIKGQIRNTKQESVSYTNVLLKKDTLNLIIDYTTADEQGNYAIEINKKGQYRLEFSALGYQTKTLNIEVTDNQEQQIKNIILSSKAFSINEVIVSAERPIQEKNDTVVFDAKHFATGNEEVVEDLLKKIPGISVESNGTIKVGNKEVEKLMVDGDDFFEKGYRLLSKNMPSHPIDKIEVLNHFSDNRLLKGIEQSDKVALNLTLKDEFKRIWFGSALLGYGFVPGDRYEAKFNLANFGKKNKFFFIGNANNIGYNATGDIAHLIRPFRLGNSSSIGDDQQCSPLLYLSTSGLSFNSRRTNFNNAKMFSLNAIFNPSEKLKIKALAFFNWDKTHFYRQRTDSVYMKDNTFTNYEDYHLYNQKIVGFARLDLNYTISKNRILESTTKFNNGQFDDGSDLLFNTYSTTENLNHSNLLFDQKVVYTHRFKNKKVLLLTGRFINEKMPQEYFVNRFFYQNLFPNDTTINAVQQNNSLGMQYAGFNAHWLDRTKKGHLMEFQLGNEYRNDDLNTVFSLLENKKEEKQPPQFQNKTIYQVNDLYLKSKYSYQWGRLVLEGSLDAHQLFNYLNNEEKTQTQRPIFINPQCGLNWEINHKNKVITSYSYNTNNVSVLKVYNHWALNGFRSFKKGLGEFNQLHASQFFINYQNGSWSDRFFANIFAVYIKNHDFLTTHSFISQDYTLSEPIWVKNRQSFNLNGKFDYYIKKIRSNLKLDLAYFKSNFKNKVNHSKLRNIYSTNYRYGLELRSGFMGNFNFHIGTKWLNNQVKAEDIKQSFVNNISFLDVLFVFNKKWNIQVESERYYYGQLKTDKVYYFLDIKAQYKYIKNKLTFTFNAKNIFNTEYFRMSSVSDIAYYLTEYRLLPRMLLLSVQYRF